MLSRMKQILSSTGRLLATSADASLRSRRFQAKDVLLFVTYRCTSRCVGCNIWQRPNEVSRELEWPQWEPIFENLASAGVNKIELFGGDALLRKDLLLDMIRFCRANGIVSFLPTNSNGLTESTVRDLVEAGLDVVYLSLDELPDMDGTIRGTKRHFERVMQAIDWFREARGASKSPRIECLTTVAASNWRRVPELLAATRDRGADAHELWTMSEFPPSAVETSAVAGIVPNPYFMSTDGTSHRLSRHEAEALRSMVSDLRARSRDYAPMSINTETIEHLDVEALSTQRFPYQKCLPCTNMIVLSPYGEVTPCPYFGKYVLGNLSDSRLDEVWGNAAHRRFVGVQRREHLPICDHCSWKFAYRPFVATVRNEVRRVRERFL
jgi:Fe-coproporphyrin III synthase